MNDIYSESCGGAESRPAKVLRKQVPAIMIVFSSLANLWIAELR